MHTASNIDSVEEEKEKEETLTSSKNGVRIYNMKIIYIFPIQISVNSFCRNI